jgi:hypothetical protein
MTEDYPRREVAGCTAKADDDLVNPPIPPSEALLDEAVENTFPASDPISIDHAFNAALDREDVESE